ncbi:MAG TPA: ABC transporter permease, partial [Anaerolineae bacterium]
MLRIRWRKVILDLLGHKARTLLVVLAIAVGVFAVGFVISAQSILLRELQRDYAATRAAAAILYTEPFDDEMVASISRMPEVAAAEGRRRLRVRASAGDNVWRDLVLTAIPDYTNIQLDRIVPVKGQWPPAEREVLVEQQSLDYLGAQVGDTITVELDDGHQERLAIAGLVHDNSVPSAQILDRAFGYITPDTVEALGEGHTFTELRFTVAENGTNLGHIRAVGQAIEDKLERSGREVFAIDVPPPGEHWAEEIIETLVLLFIVFGALILFLSGFLVINTISALLAQQIKQIGIMKLVGARRPQIMAMYFVMVLVYGLLSLGVGVPPSILAAHAVVDLAAGLLNVSVDSYSVPPMVLSVQAAVGLMVPLLAALWPVVNGVQITTYQALNSLDIGQGSYGRGTFDRLFVRLQEGWPVQRPLIISLRNMVRRKKRLALTLATLILGTALFIAVLSVRDSVQLTLDNFMRYHRYDVAVNMNRLYRTEQLERLARSVPGVIAVESWTGSSARRLRPDDTKSDALNLLAVPADTVLMEPQVEAGRWLRPGDENAIVVNSDFVDGEAEGITVGDEIVL